MHSTLGFRLTELYFELLTLQLSSLLLPKCAMSAACSGFQDESRTLAYFLLLSLSQASECDISYLALLSVCGHFQSALPQADSFNPLGT